MHRALSYSLVLVLGGALLTSPFVESPKGETPRSLHNVAFSPSTQLPLATAIEEKTPSLPTFEEGKRILAEKYQEPALCQILGNKEIESCLDAFWTEQALKTRNTLYCKALSNDYAFTFCLVETKRREAREITNRPKE